MFKAIIILFILFSAPLSFAQEEKPAQAQQAADPNLWDFGKVKEGEVLEHKFIFKNNSSKIINIKSVNTSCGCTASKAKKNNLAPQGSAEIEVKFKTKGYSGLTKQYIYVNTDNADEPVARFIIQAEIVK